VFPLSSLQSEFQIAGFDIKGGGPHLRVACELIAARARELALSWSIRTPLMMRVMVVGNVGIIEDYAPPGRPAELRLNHPLFGDRRHWYGPPGRPFLRPAAEEKIDEAALEYAKSVDDHARELGWK
jgi:hypothetical protein